MSTGSTGSEAQGEEADLEQTEVSVAGRGDDGGRRAPGRRAVATWALRAAACTLVGGAVAWGAHARASDAPAEASALPAHKAGDTAAFRLFFTADTRGHVHPCGCSEGQFGGLPRRATYLGKERRPGDLLLDLGNLVEGTRPHERLKLGYVLEGLRLLEYDLLVPGEG